MNSKHLRSRLGFALVAGLLASGCATSTIPDSALEGVALLAVNPNLVVPESTVVIEGLSFVGEPFGASTLRLRGVYQPIASSQFDLDVTVPARFVDFEHMEITADADFFAAVENLDGLFVGEATIEVLSTVDEKTYVTSPLEVQLGVFNSLTPRLETLQSGGVIFVNDRIEIAAQALLLGGSEGTTFAVVTGCYTPQGQATCAPIAEVEVPIVPSSPFDRSTGHFNFSPAIAGIQPGTFDGQILLRNRHASGTAPESPSQAAIYSMVPSEIFRLNTAQASLGQYIDIEGGGFVGQIPGASTVIQLDGTFTPTGAPQGGPVDIVLVPEFSSGNLVRYVMNEEDMLGQALDLRLATGVFVGDVTPVVSYLGDQVAGPTVRNISFDLVPLKQVVYLDFQISYVESLRKFGLRAVDSFIRDRIADNVRRDFPSINLDIRLEEPKDFALYTRVEIGGPDLQEVGLFGYDNAPGKDIDNDRLHDHIGGTSATMQEDGSPGYGGIFIETLFGFSQKPGSLAQSLPGADKRFDDIFDPFRPDRDGNRVVASDLAAGFPKLDNADSCPAGSRPDRIACGIWALGSLVSSTVSHELGHSLGLADPRGNGLHNLGDVPNRLMDAGLDRPFAERAELDGQGPARFCDEEYNYLREILPSSGQADPTPRPSCR